MDKKGLDPEGLMAPPNTFNTVVLRYVYHNYKYFTQKTQSEVNKSRPNIDV